ncbi:single-stranded DNA-binding protein, partial [Streptomyces sparsus]
MNETMVTVVGNVATEPEFRTTAAGVPVVRFRLATTVRRFDRERGGWADAHTSFYTVRAWRALARNLSSSVALGEPLLVHGRLRVQEGEREGGRWSDTSIDALSAGHDLARGTSAFARPAGSTRPTASTSPAASPNGPSGRGVHADPSPSFGHGSLPDPSAVSAGGDRAGARASPTAA